MTRQGDVVDRRRTVPELVADGYALQTAIAARAFGRWLELMGPPPATSTEPSNAHGRVQQLARELGVEPLKLEHALVAYASGFAGADRELLELLGEPLE